MWSVLIRPTSMLLHRSNTSLTRFAMNPAERSVMSRQPQPLLPEYNLEKSAGSICLPNGPYPLPPGIKTRDFGKPAAFGKTGTFSIAPDLASRPCITPRLGHDLETGRQNARIRRARRGEISKKKIRQAGKTDMGIGRY